MLINELIIKLRFLQTNKILFNLRKIEGLLFATMLINFESERNPTQKVLHIV